MNRLPVFIIIVLVTILMSMLLARDPDMADRYAEMGRQVAFEGDAREVAMGAVVLAIGGFIVYLLSTRR